MEAAQNNKEDTTYRQGALQLEITGLDAPLLSNTKKRGLNRENLPPTEPLLFKKQPLEMIATGAPVISATQAYIKQPEWHEYSPGKLYFQKRFGKGRYIEFYILNKQEQQPEGITHQAEQEILERYGVMAARLHAVFATYAAQQNRPWEEPFSLLGSDLIKIVRLNRRKDMTKSEKLMGIADLAWIVGTLGAAIHWREGELDLRITRKSPVWNILYIEEYYQSKIPGFDGQDELCEVVIGVQPGAWTQKFLNKTGSQARLALHQYGFIHEKFFDLNPYTQKLAVGLALYIIQNRRAHPNGKYRILTLLEAILSPSEIQALQRDRNRSRFIKQFHKLLLALVDADFRIEFGSSYPENLRPIWAELPNEDLEVDPVATAPLSNRAAPNCFEAWLNSVVTISSPLAIEAKVVEFENEKTKKAKAVRRKERSKKLDQSNQVSIDRSDQQPTLEPSSPPVELTATMVQQARHSMGYTQANLASLVGKSVSWVKLIESGRRKILPQAQETLQKVLDL
jgi:ribosome-binding protein aMBF1 (putative translation factor)